MLKIILLTLSALYFVACSSKSTVVLLESDKAQNTVFVQTNTNKVTLNQTGNYIDVMQKTSTPIEVKTMSQDEINTRFAQTLATEPRKPVSYIVYFKMGSTELTEASKATLEEALNTIKKRFPCSVDVIGHTDTVGSSKLNQKISLKRADLIASMVKKQKPKVVSLTAKGFGEEDLLVQTKNNKAEAQNRNVEIFIK